MPLLNRRPAVSVASLRDFIHALRIFVEQKVLLRLVNLREYGKKKR